MKNHAEPFLRVYWIKDTRKGMWSVQAYHRSFLSVRSERALYILRATKTGWFLPMKTFCLFQSIVWSNTCFRANEAHNVVWRGCQMICRDLTMASCRRTFFCWTWRFSMLSGGLYPQPQDLVKTREVHGTLPCGRWPTSLTTISLNTIKLYVMNLAVINSCARSKVLRLSLRDVPKKKP